MRTRIAFALSGALALFVGGCSSGTASSAAESADGNLEQPFTIADYRQNRTIQAIDAEVSRIEGLSLTRRNNAGCDSTTAEFLDTNGKIYKVQEWSGGEGGPNDTVTAY